MKRFDLCFIYLLGWGMIPMMLSPVILRASLQSPEDVEARAYMTIVAGKPLSEWVEKVTTDLNEEECNATVAALTSAIVSEDNAVCVIAADALAVLGPRAKSAAWILIVMPPDE